MISRFLLATVLAGAFVPVVASPADAAGTGITVSDVTVVEPNHPDTSTLVPVEITLDQPATEPVNVIWYARNATETSWDNRAIEAADGSLTFAPGEVTKTVTVTVLRARTYQDGSFWVRAVEQSGSTGWTGVGYGTVLNSDRAGTWECWAVSLFGGTTVTPPWPLPDSLVQDWYAGTAWANCDGTGWPGDVPDTVPVGAYTVTASAGQAEVDRAAQPPAGDTRPFVGDGVTMSSSVSTLAITGPGLDVRIDGIWARASSHCEALDTVPSLTASSGVGSVVINGQRVVQDLTEPASYRLAPGLTLSLNSPNPYGTRTGRIAVSVISQVATTFTSVWAGYAQAGYIDNPCTT